MLLRILLHALLWPVLLASMCCTSGETTTHICWYRKYSQEKNDRIGLRIQRALARVCERLLLAEAV